MANDQVTASPPSTITAAKLNDITVGTTAPTSPTLGWTWVDTSSSPPITKIWGGSAWAQATSYTGIGDIVRVGIITNGTAIGSNPVVAAKWSPDGTKLLIADSSRVYVAPYDTTLGLGQVGAASANVAGSGIKDIAWSPDGAFVAVAHFSSPFVSVFPVSGTTIGTKVANPGTLPTAAGTCVAWNPAGTYIAVGFNSPPSMNIYAWSAGAFGAKNSPTPFTNNPSRCAWSPDGLSLSVAEGSAPYLEGWPVSGAGVPGAKFTAPVTTPTGAAQSVAINAAGDLIAIAHATTPFVSVYPYNSATGFGTKLTNPLELPPAAGAAIRWHEVTINGSAIKQLLVGIGGVPSFVLYGFASSVFSNQNRSPIAPTVSLFGGVASTFLQVIQAEVSGPSLDINPVNHHVVGVSSGPFGVAPSNLFFIVPNSG